MKYTKDDLAKMSDFELTCALAKMQGFETSNFNFEDVAVISKGAKTTTFDYRDWSDIMPLAIEHGVCLTSPIASHKNKWQASQTDGGGKWSADDFYFSNESPQRAIACCLILVLQESQQ